VKKHDTSCGVVLDG
jgi:NADH:ubiquinone oxidoreductase subunit K